jgi:hypothetical protein
MTDFQPFPKIPRWSSQNIVITEKIDGTNAQIVINDECTEFKCGSRNRWVTPDDDNYGFARWAHDNKEHILRLGKGQHFGEWWGQGIQRGYGLPGKRFSLFNTYRWGTPEQAERLAGIDGVGVVPVLYEGPFSDAAIEEAMVSLKENGSRVSPGFMMPEGIIIYMPGSRSLFKMTYEFSRGKWDTK